VETSKLKQVSYGFLVAMLVLAGWLHMMTLVLSVLFSVFALRKLHFGRSKLPALGLFLLLVAAISYGFVYFVKEAVQALPSIAERSIPMIIDYAQKHGVELPFYDFDSLKALAMSGVKDQLRQLGNFARIATKEFALLVIGVVVAVSLFLNPRFERGRSLAAPHNLYSLFCQELAARFASFYQSFAVVIGAQLAISLVNTSLTAIFVTWTRLPHPAVMIVITLVCGLLPIVGNLVSNSIIVLFAFTVSPEMALASLIFLVGVHKLEYLLNSKIIGDRIKNPVWLTLLGLILGERLLGIPGMIIAPVVLYFLKVEASQIRIPAAPNPREPAELVEKGQ
jgi:predicted PurR-regulated permease PerM